MRALVVAVLILAACSNPSAPVSEIADEPPQPGRAAPVTDLEFQDAQLQPIAMELIREARLRGIEESVGRNRAERLIALEASLSDSRRALDCIDTLAAEITATDASQWAQLRQDAERDFAARDDETARRVRSLLAGWRRRKSESAYDYLSSHYTTTYVRSYEWERRFHDYVRERPIHAATWAWLVWRDYAGAARQQYGRADAESAYRYYIESSGLGDRREARMIFSVPGIQIADAPEPSAQRSPRRSVWRDPHLPSRRSAP